MNKTNPTDATGNQVCILMGTFQGERHLLEQLESIRAQTYCHWRLFASDDGSTDNTVTILRDFQESLPRGQMEIFAGPRMGFAANFMNLLLNSSIQGDYFAFCDQDDVWDKEKLNAALFNLKTLSDSGDKPAAYGSVTTLVDDNLKVLGTSHADFPVPSFKNALVQNIAGANTIVLNRKLRELIQEVGHADVVSHDWWVYLVCTGAGGCFHFDETPRILYRQHDRNLIGANPSIKAQPQRLKQVMYGRYRRWMDMNLRALENSRTVLTNENVKTLESLVALRKMPLPSRVIELHKAGIRRQSWLGNFGLFFACLLNRL